MTDLTQILKNAPKGVKLYSPVVGEVIFDELINSDSDTGYAIKTKLEDGRTVYFTKYGRYCKSGVGECLLFPSKDHMSWDNVSFKPTKPDLPRNTLMVTFVKNPKFPQEVVLLHYTTKGHCTYNNYKGGDGTVEVKPPHAIPFDKFNFETMSWDPADDYGYMAGKEDADLPNPHEIISKILELMKK